MEVFTSRDVKLGLGADHVGNAYAIIASEVRQWMGRLSGTALADFEAGRTSVRVTLTTSVVEGGELRTSAQGVLVTSASDAGEVWS